MSFYFESHVTIEPVFDDRLNSLKEICRQFNFHVADLLLKKRDMDTEERSRNDSFCTGRSKNYKELELKTRNLIVRLKEKGYQIWRYKIEEAIIDSKYEDSLNLIK
jgi:hypothetical protein